MAHRDSEDWMADMRHWAAHGPEATRPEGVTSEFDELGYEAANPPLQARHWPDASGAED